MCRGHFSCCQTSCWALHMPTAPSIEPSRRQADQSSPRCHFTLMTRNVTHTLWHNPRRRPGPERADTHACTRSLHAHARSHARSLACTRSHARSLACTRSLARSNAHTHAHMHAHAHTRSQAAVYMFAPYAPCANMRMFIHDQALLHMHTNQ